MLKLYSLLLPLLFCAVALAAPPEQKNADKKGKKRKFNSDLNKTPTENLEYHCLISASAEPSSLTQKNADKKVKKRMFNFDLNKTPPIGEILEYNRLISASAEPSSLTPQFAAFTSPTSSSASAVASEPIHINDLPAHILNERILARVDWRSRRNFKLTDKKNSKTVIDLFDEFLQICQQANRYLACWKYALYLLKESTGEFARKNLLQEAFQRAVKKGNGWAVSALSDVVEFRTQKDQDFYFRILQNYLNERKSNQDLITLDVLRRKSIEMNHRRAEGLAYNYKYSEYITDRFPRTGVSVLLDESSIAAIEDAIKTSDHQQVYTLIQPFFPYGLRKAGILSYACQYGDQFAVFYATKDFVMARKREERPGDSTRRQLEEENSSKEEKSSTLPDAYEQARIVGNEDVVEFFQQFHGIHGEKKIGTGGLAESTPPKSINPCGCSINDIDSFKSDYSPPKCIDPCGCSKNTLNFIDSFKSD